MTALITTMTTDVNVGMNEVVSVFVAKYEDQLFAKKDRLSDLIRQIKADLATLDRDLIKSVNKADYAASVVNLGLSFAVTDITIGWTADYSVKKANQIRIVVEMTDENNKRDYSKTYLAPISQVDIDTKALLTNKLEAANTDLLEVMSQIKQVSRKERQIRGRISEMKLEQAGQSDLISNPELLKLVMI